MREDICSGACIGVFDTPFLKHHHLKYVLQTLVLRSIAFETFLPVSKIVHSTSGSSAKPVTGFPSWWCTAIRSVASRSHVIAATIVIFQCTTYVAIWSLCIVMSSAVAKPVPCQDSVASICQGIRATVLGVLTKLACFALFKVQVLACATHPVSSSPAHSSWR